MGRIKGGRGTRADGTSFNRSDLNMKLLPNESIIGIKGGVLTYTEDDNSHDGLTQTTTFISNGDWIEQRPDAARVLLTNSSGSSIELKSVAIHGKPVTMLAKDEGFIHDSFADWDDIEKYGEKVFEFGNVDTVTKTQLEKLADYWWKYHKVAKHIYVVQLTGMWHFLQPGEWATLDIGTAGESENIDSKVEVFNVRMTRGPGELGETVLILREIEEAWKNDSNALARFIASGDISRLYTNKEVLVVGAQYYARSADSYCDGTADESEINTAITTLNTRGGGVVQLTQGTYTLSTPIQMKSNVTLTGVGTTTIIEQNDIGDFAIQGNGGSGTELTNIVLSDLKVINTGASNTKDVIKFTYVDNSEIRKVRVDGTDATCISATDCDGFAVIDCTLLNGASGMSIRGARFRCLNNVIQTMTSSTANNAQGILLSGASDGAVVANNNIEAISYTGSSAVTFGAGIYCLGTERITFANNTIKTVSSSHASAQGAYGMYLWGGAANLLQDITVSNNTITAVSSATDSYGISMDEANDCIIEGCLIRTVTESGSGTAWGIFVDDDCDRVKITDCQVIASAHEGIEIEGDNGTIQDNIVSGCDVGILIDNTADRNVTTANHVYGNTSAQITDNGTNQVTANNLTA